MTRLKILYATEYYDPSFLSDWVEIPRGLSKRGHEVTVLSPSIGRDDRRMKADDYHENENLRIVHRNFLGVQSPFSEAVLRLYAPIVGSSYDIVHANNLFVGSNVPLVLGRLIKKSTKTIVNTEIESKDVLRSVVRFAPWMRVLDKAFVNAFHCISESGRRSLLSFGIRPEKIWVIPQGVNFRSFQSMKRRDADDGEVTIGFMGRVTPQKGLDRVANVLRKLLGENRNVRVVIAGPIPPKWEQYARNLFGGFSAEDRFRYVGYVSDVRDFLSKIDIFLLPTREEATAKTPLEVMSAGIPMVASDIMPLTDYIQHGVSGLLAHKEEEFYDYLKTLCEDSQLRSRMGEAARQSASRHDWDSVLDKIESMYEYRTSEILDAPLI